MNRTDTQVRHTERGMTLLEVLLSLGVLAGMLVLVWSITTTADESKRELEALSLRVREVRVAMARTVRDLEHAFLSGAENQQAPERRSDFVGKEASDVDTLEFSSLAHVPMFADAHEADSTKISYAAVDDRQVSRITHWVRTETAWLPEKGDREPPATAEILVRNVASVEFEYYDRDKNEWEDQWKAWDETHKGRLPTYVRLTVEVPLDPNDASGRQPDNLKFTEIAKLELENEVVFFVAD